MANNLKKLIDLAKKGGSRFFVLDENGNPDLVMMSVEEYEKLLVEKIASQADEIEEINKKILLAQKEEQQKKDEAFQDELKSEVIDSTFSFEVPQKIE